MYDYTAPQQDSLTVIDVGDLAKRAIAYVILNRTRTGSAPDRGKTVHAVCTRQDQFACWSKDSPYLSILGNLWFNNRVFNECVIQFITALSSPNNDITSG